ncbi:MAG TPA: vWA domain-containing protein [Nannocystaceae bacterium]|nr:vWA domain-containing protein [Nannocystaceae bacterium]
MVAALALVLACHDESPPGAAESTGESGIVVDETSSESGPKLDMGVVSLDTSITNPDSQTDGCTDITVTVTPVVPTIYLQVDRSGSMTADFGGQSRWSALYETLMGPGGTVDALQSDVRFGLAMYSSVDGDAGGQCPMLTEVPPALDNYDAIDAVYGPAEPIDETPTGESLALVAAELAAFTEPGPKAIVLATDGEPDTCAEPNPQNGQPQTIAAVQAAYADDIDTYVISVGTEGGASHLQQVANAGVGKAIDDPSPAQYYVALEAADLVDAFHGIIASFVSCAIPIDGVVALDQQCEGTLSLDGSALPCPAQWHMIDASTVELLGYACDVWKDGISHEIDASWPCGVVEIP